MGKSYSKILIIVISLVIISGIILAWQSGWAQENITEAKINKLLPAGYSIISYSPIYYEDVNNDGTKETLFFAGKNHLEKSLFIFKQENSEYKLEKQIEIPLGNVIGEFLIKDLNGNKVPEIIYTYSFGAGETLPLDLNIIEWNGKDYNVLFNKTTTLLFRGRGRPDIKGRSNRLIRDLNNDGKFEVIVPTDDPFDYYQIYCDYPEPGCASLLKYQVYKWDGKDYIEAAPEFLEVYDEEVKLAEEFLKGSSLREDNRKKILKYLQDINNLKETSGRRRI